MDQVHSHDTLVKEKKLKKGEIVMRKTKDELKAIVLAEVQALGVDAQYHDLDADANLAHIGANVSLSDEGKEALQELIDLRK